MKKLIEVPVIHATAIYTAAQVNALFGLRTSTIRREIREGRLKVSRRAGRYYFLGTWLVAWIEGGELKRSPRSEAAELEIRNGVYEGRQ